MANEIRHYIIESEELLYEALIDKFPPKIQEKLRKFKHNIFPLLKIFGSIGLGVLLFALAAGSARIAYEHYTIKDWSADKKEAWENIKKKHPGVEKDHFEQTWKQSQDAKGGQKTSDSPHSSYYTNPETKLRDDFSKQEEKFNRSNPDKDLQNKNKRVNAAFFKWFRGKSTTDLNIESESAKEAMLRMAKDLGRDQEMKDFILKNAGT